MIYIDSGFFIALIDTADDAHAQAFRLLDTYFTGAPYRGLTTRDVLNEVLAHFSRSAPSIKHRAADLVRDLLDRPNFRVEVIDNRLYMRALDLYENRLDKRYSMVDCIGMTLMRAEGIHDVMATDRDFQQEGFTNLIVRNR